MSNQDNYPDNDYEYDEKCKDCEFYNPETIDCELCQKCVDHCLCDLPKCNNCRRCFGEDFAVKCNQCGDCGKCGGCCSFVKCTYEGCEKLCNLYVEGEICRCCKRCNEHCENRVNLLTYLLSIFANI